MRLLIRLPVLLAALAAGCAREAAREAAPASEGAQAASPVSGEIRYMALGDSFTIGTGSRASEAFPARLAERLRGSGRAVTLKNLGVNGYTTQDLLDFELPEVAPFSPTLVTVAVGANDIVRGIGPERYRAQVRRILGAVIAAGVPAGSVVALPQPDWSRSRVGARFGDPAELGGAIEAFNVILAEEAAAVGARYFDLFPLMRRQAEAKMVAEDGLHPSAQAHDEWAGEIAAQLGL